MINIPNEASGGSLTGDIIYANNKIFTYSPDSISVYYASDAGYIGKIHLSNWGKFNPVYFNANFWPGEFNAMEYNQTSGMLYAITPNLHLKVINTLDISESWDISLYVQFPGTENLEDLLETLNGRLVMKYDSNHERLYILVSARDPEYELNCPGNFHTRRGFFGIYNVDNSIDPYVAGYLSLHYNEIYDIDLQQCMYEDQINNFEFNTKQGQDYFYLTRLNRFEIWKIPDIGSVTMIEDIFVNNDYFDTFYKFGKMLCINNEQNQLHKIVIVPYRFPTEQTEDNTGIVFTINGDHLDNIVPNDIKEFYAPSKRVTDVVYLESSNDLIMSYAPDDDVQHTQQPNILENSDVAVYSYSQSNFSFHSSYITNQP